MPSYEVKLSNLSGLTLKNGHNVAYVEAADAADARAAVAGHFDGDSGWSGADVTEITVAADLSPVTNEQNKVRTFKLKLWVTGATVDEYFEYEAEATDSIDDLWAAMPALLNASDNIANAAWSTPNLTVASIADGIGDHTVVAQVCYGDEELPSFVVAVTDGGIAGAALVVEAEPAAVIPLVTGSARSA